MRTSGWALPVLYLAAVTLRAEQLPTFKGGVNLVRVDVLVTDGGAPIRGLAAADFEVRDNGVVQHVQGVLTEAEALDVLFVFDVSQSLEGTALEHLKEAALAVLDRLHEGDRAGLVTFSHRIQTPIALTPDLTHVRRGVRGLGTSGSTSLLDALFVAFLDRERSVRRTMMLVFSDGLDNRSWLSADQVGRVAKQADVVLYAVAFKGPSPSTSMTVAPVASHPDGKLLGTLAAATGGRLLVRTESRGLQGAFVQLLEEMRTRYLLTYSPDVAPKPGWHSVTVRLKNRQGRVTARAGYMVR